MTSTIFFFAFIPLLALILLAVNLVFAPHNPYMEKDNVFECGFSSFLGQNRTQFSISFFIFALLFLLFDLEILLVYPYLVSAYTNEVYGLAIMLMFLLALTLGFAFELGKKALSIDSRQGSSEEPAKPSTSLSSILRASTSPSPYSSVRLPLQSGYLKALLSRIMGLFTFEVLTVLIIAIGFSMAYRYPMLIIFESLGLQGYYPWINLVTTLVFIQTIAELKCKPVESERLVLACIFALLIPAALWYFGYFDISLLINTAWLSEVIISLTAKLSFVARGIRILWEMARGDASQRNGGPDKLPLGPKYISPANPPKVSDASPPKEIEAPVCFAKEPGQNQGQGGSGKGEGDSRALVPVGGRSSSSSPSPSSSTQGSTRPESSGTPRGALQPRPSTPLQVRDPSRGLVGSRGPNTSVRDPSRDLVRSRWPNTPASDNRIGRDGTPIRNQINDPYGMEFRTQTSFLPDPNELHARGTGGAIIPQNIYKDPNAGGPGRPGPVGSLDIMAESGLGDFEWNGHGWVRTNWSIIDNQEYPQIPFKLHTTRIRQVSDADLVTKYPNHVPGRRQGWGIFGANNLNSFTPLLDDNKLMYEVDRFAVNIPPQRGDAMLSSSTTFWRSLWRKYDGQTIDLASQEWYTWFRVPNANYPDRYKHDTLIDIKTTEGGNREELKTKCIDIMNNSLENMRDPDNYPTVEYWKFLHEFMAARHFYQVYLLDDRTF